MEVVNTVAYCDTENNQGSKKFYSAGPRTYNKKMYNAKMSNDKTYNNKTDT